MNILFLDQFNELGGAQQCLLDLVDGMRSGNLHAGLPGDGPLARALRERGVDVHHLPELSYSHGHKSVKDVFRYGWDALRLVPRLRRIVRANGIDLVYVNGPRLLPAASMAAKNLVFHAHSYLDKRYAASMARWSLRRNKARALASSEFVASALRPSKVRVIYNGVREIPFRPPKPAAIKPWRIGIVGRIAPEKGQVDFVGAARILQDWGIDAEFRIQGEPLFSGATYANVVRDLSRDLPVTFAGWSNDIASIFADLDLLVVASTWVEANPRVIIEAFSAGVPVVSYPAGGIPELIEDGVTGALTQAATPESLADSIARMLGDPARMNRIARAARATWEERFTLQRYVREVLEFLGTAPTGNIGPQLLRAGRL